MKISLGSVSFKGNLVFILAVTLLFTDVISVSIRMPVETTVAVTPTVADGREAEVPEKEGTLDKYNLKPDELEIDSSEGGLTELDDSWDYIGAIIPDQEELDSPKDNRTEGDNKEQGATLWGSLNTSEANIPEFENLIADEEDDSLALLSLLVKRAVEENYGASEPEAEALSKDEESEPEAQTIDEDDFSFSDLPKIFQPLIKAFSGSPESEPPPPEDFFSWFPSLKELLDAPKEEPAPVTSSPRNSVMQPETFGLPTPSEPSLQMAPAVLSAQDESDESSSEEEPITSIVPTLPIPPSNE